MARKLILENGFCLNCDHQYSGSHCPSCGQKALDNADRSMLGLATGFIGNIFFLDSRFFVSLKYLLTRPGKMTVEFLEGKRKKFLPPVTLFLFINLVYFFLTPLTDYSLPLSDQVNLQPYSSATNQLINDRLDERGISFNEYETIYNKASDNISKSVMILNVPLFSLFVYLLSFWKRQFFFDSLIFGLHYYTFFLTSICVGHLLNESIIYFFGSSFAMNYWVLVFLLIIPLTYLITSFKKYSKFKWWLAGGISFILLFGLAFSQFLYRGIIFFLTYLFT